MTVNIPVILAGSEASILFLDEEEGGGLGGLGWANLPRAKVLVDKLIHSFSFFDGERVEFPYFWNKGFI